MPVSSANRHGLWIGKTCTACPNRRRLVRIATAPRNTLGDGSSVHASK